SLYRAEDNVMRHVARHGYSTALRIGETRPITRGLMSGRVMIDGQTLHIHDFLTEIHEYPDARAAQQLSGTRTYLATPLLREGSAIGCIVIRRKEVRPFTEKQIALLKPFATRQSSQSRTCGCSRNCRSAMRNCAKRWSIRRQPPRCSASSAARPPTCSRCSTPLLRALLGSAELMMWGCGSAKGMRRFSGLILALYLLAASRLVLMNHRFAGFASMARFTFPTSTRRSISQRWVPVPARAPFYSFPFVSKGTLLGQ